jgi:hypothetical protein
VEPVLRPASAWWGTVAVAAYGLSFLFSYSDGNYNLLFIIGTSAMLIAFVIDVVAVAKSSTDSRSI